MPRIVISYRREDTAGHAGRLHDRLVQEFGKEEVFLDTDIIAPGDDWLAAIERALAQCESLVAVIGRRWLLPTERGDRRRLNGPGEYVRMEIATALKREILVVPVLVEGAAMPSKADLPAVLRPLTRRQPLKLSHEGFHTDVQRLAQALRARSAAGATAEPRAPAPAPAPAPPSAAESGAAPRPAVDETWVRHCVELIAAAQDDATGGFRNQLFDADARPQTWSTAQCVVALGQLPELGRLLPALETACDSMEATRQPAGGWGYDVAEGEETVTEVGCWVTLAHLCLLEHPDVQARAPRLAAALGPRVERDLEWMVERQHPAGGWSPVRRVDPRRNQRTYTSMMALWTLLKARHCDALAAAVEKHDSRILRTVRWLLNGFDATNGWVPNPGRSPQARDFLGLTAQLLAVLHYAEVVGRERDVLHVLHDDPTYREARRWFLGHEDLPVRKFAWNDSLPDIDQELSGTSFHLEGSTFLWCPWSLLTLGVLAADPRAGGGERARAAALRQRSVELLTKHRKEIGINGTYEMAETLLSLAPLAFGGAPALGIRS